MTEEQVYATVEKVGNIELRAYDPCVIAEIAVEGSFEGAGNKAFRPLVSFIGGRNQTGKKVAMTAPVIQDVPDGRADGNEYVVSFVMPAGSTRDDMPDPTDTRVQLRAVPAHEALAIRFSGRWTASSFSKNLATLENAAKERGLQLIGDPRLARYDPPWTPWFRRRNEVVWTVAPSE
ncbi:MAG: heme-binding protein [Actinobacteria bacterium]|nr:heme-binding protein [Actinomycetota bacterium]